jgi:predicted nucleic acid-binding Zn ribbon protein
MIPVQRTIPDFLSHLLRKAPLSQEKISFAWRAAVGPAISRVSSVRLTTAGTVEVHCADDHWRREIRRSAAVIKERLVSLLGADMVRHLKVAGAGRKGEWSRGRRTSDPRTP